MLHHAAEEGATLVLGVDRQQRRELCDPATPTPRSHCRSLSSNQSSTNGPGTLTSGRHARTTIASPLARQTLDGRSQRAPLVDPVGTSTAAVDPPDADGPATSAS